MARSSNYLLGRGERLTGAVEVRSGGSAKNPPYTFEKAKRRLAPRLAETAKSMADLPAAACPQDEAVGIVTLHPRYVAKSDFPRDLFERVGLRAVGSRLRVVQPEQWGTKKHPAEAYAEDIFVAGPRNRFYEWADSLSRWDQAEKGADKLLRLEDIAPFEAAQKGRNLPDDQQSHFFEVVLHNDGGDLGLLKEFERYALSLGTRPIMERRRDIQGLTFLPVKATTGEILELGDFSFLRVARGMPSLRPFAPSPFRDVGTAALDLPSGGPLDPGSRVVIFDGGLPSKPDLSKWARLIEPDGIGPASELGQNHGLAVTSAFLFGSVKPGETLPRPLCSVDHVRVLEANPSSDDLAYLDVLTAVPLTFTRYQAEAVRLLGRPRGQAV